MLIGTGRGQQKRGIVARFLVPTCIVMNKNVFMCMHWIALNVFKLVLALQKLFQNNNHRTIVGRRKIVFLQKALKP